MQHWQRNRQFNGTEQKVKNNNLLSHKGSISIMRGKEGLYNCRIDTTVKPIQSKNDTIQQNNGLNNKL